MAASEMEEMLRKQEADASGTQVAGRKAGVIHYLFGDHLGSTSMAYNASSGATVMQL